MNFDVAIAVAFASFDSLEGSGIVPEGTMMMNGPNYFVRQIDDEHIPSPTNLENIDDDEHLLK